MAGAKIVYRPGDGVKLEVMVTVDASYPDAVDQARLECVKLFEAAAAVARIDYIQRPDGEATAPDA